MFLVGFMGAGKTTVGRILARRLDCWFVDLDDLIRAREGREITGIFRDSGEAYFRKVESECLRELLGRQEAPSTGADSGRSPGMAPTELPHIGSPRSPMWASGESMVVALGGGAFAQAENAALLRARGAPVIFLDAAIEELRRRCGEQGGERPLFRDENQFRQLYEARRGSYMAAELRVDTGGKTPEQVAEEILQISGLRAVAGDSE